jgi:hypothetical protein
MIQSLKVNKNIKKKLKKKKKKRWLATPILAKGVAEPLS